MSEGEGWHLYISAVDELALTLTQNLRFHDLRHEATSRLFEKGLGAADIKLITGHKTYEMLDRYTHLSARKISEKLAMLDEVARLDSEIKNKRAELRLVV